MNVNDFKVTLINQGYRYFLLDNIESQEDGTALFHYELLQEIPIEICINHAIAIESSHACEIIQEFLIGTAIFWINTGQGYHINSSGRIFRNQRFKKLKF